MRFLVAVSYLVLWAAAPGAVLASEGPGGSNGEGEAAYGLWHSPFRNDPPIYLRRRGPSGPAAFDGPEDVGNLRLDRGWGAAQMLSGVHLIPIPEFGAPPRANPRPQPKPDIFTKQYPLPEMPIIPLLSLEPGPRPSVLVVRFNPPPSGSAISAFNRKHRMALIRKLGKGAYAFRYDDRRPSERVAEELQRERSPRVVNVDQVM